MSSKEIITDEMRSFIGLESDPVTYVVEKHSIEHFARAIGESNPIYFDEQFAKDNVGGIIAPPTFIRLFRPKRLEKQFPDSFSNLVDGGSSYTFHEKIFVGDQITVVSKLKDLFIKQGYTIDWKELEKQSLDETINALAMASPFSLEEKQVLLESRNLDIRKNKISEILKTYTHDLFNNNTNLSIFSLCNDG